LKNINNKWKIENLGNYQTVIERRNLGKEKLVHRILVVDDDKQIIDTIRLILELNDYKPYIASNGLEALEILNQLTFPPDIILSDILMPKMGGYQFYEEVSKNRDWATIPFIFISAKSSPDDIRFGKMLGVDDYLTKPFEEADLLAVIAGKLKKSQKAKEFSSKMSNELLTTLKSDISSSLSPEERIFLFYMLWDEDYGPKLQNYFPKVQISFSIQELGSKLFFTSVSLNSQDSYYKAEGVKLRLANLEMEAFLYFDAKAEIEVRGNKGQFMLVALAPKINYIESLRIKNIFTEISIKLKKEISWEIQEYWNSIVTILTTPMGDKKLSSKDLKLRLT
jgi:DNA-binding response OmpR family regulator